MTGKILPFKPRTPASEEPTITVRDLSVTGLEDLHEAVVAFVVDGVEQTGRIECLDVTDRPFLLELRTSEPDADGMAEMIGHPMSLQEARALRDALSSVIESHVPPRRSS